MENIFFPLLQLLIWSLPDYLNTIVTSTHKFIHLETKHKSFHAADEEITILIILLFNECTGDV